VAAEVFERLRQPAVIGALMAASYSPVVSLPFPELA
jgi:hypothetical protein